MDAEQAQRVVRATQYATWRRQGGWAPLLIDRAEGSTFFDGAGHAYLDFASQLVATNLGHGNAAVIDAIARQARELAYAAPSFATPVRARASEALDEVVPAGLHHYFFSTSGTEANEAALKIARLVTGKHQVVSRPRSYHGATAGSISVTGDFRRGPIEGTGTVPGTIFAPDCYCYRCPLGLRYPSCNIACATEAGEQIDRAGDVAAMIVEPIVGTNGVILPVAEYLPRIREITRTRGVLLIADEVMTGWGRTGHWFASEHFGIVPDLLTTAKGITGGYVPLGLTATSDALRAAFEDRFFAHGHTYEAHPLPLAAAVAAIGEYRRLGLLEKSRNDGAYLLRRLTEIAARHPSVGEVRGLGLFAAVELVRDRDTRAPFNSAADQLAGRPTVAGSVQRAMLAEGVYVLAWVSHLVIAPPLIVTREELDRGLAVLDGALAVADAQVAAPGAPAAAAGSPPPVGRYDGTGQI